jgi:hypothetical protein
MMDYKVWIVTIVLLFMTSGCSTKEERAEVKECGNSFVVSDTENIFLFEYDTDTSRIVKRMEYKPKETFNQAAYSCELQKIIIAYSFRGISRSIGGLEVVDMNKKSYHKNIKDSPSNFVSHKNGLLIETELFHAELPAKELGDIPDIRESDGKEIFIYTHYITLEDIDNGTFSPTKSYRIRPRLGEGTHVYGNHLYGSRDGHLYKVDLKTGKRELYSDFTTTFNLFLEGDEGSFYVPKVKEKPIVCEHGEHGDFNESQMPKEWQKSAKIWNSMDDNALYRFHKDSKNGQWKHDKYTDLPDGIRFKMVVGDDIYFFTNNKKVLKINPVTGAKAQYPFEFSNTFSSINYIENHFVVLVPKKNGTSVYIIKKDFSKMSAPFHIDYFATHVGGISTHLNYHEHAALSE